MSRKKKHPKVYKRELKFLRDFKSGDQIYWVDTKVAGGAFVHNIFTGRVICMNDKNGQVRVICHENGRELWLYNSQPCPVPHDPSVPTPAILLDGWSRNLKPQQMLTECRASSRRDVTLSDIEVTWKAFDDEYARRFPKPTGALGEFAEMAEALGYKGIVQMVNRALGMSDAA